MLCGKKDNVTVIQNITWLQSRAKMCATLNDIKIKFANSVLLKLVSLQGAQICASFK